MKLRPIKTELDYQNALKEIERLFKVEPLSPECAPAPPDLAKRDRLDKDQK